MDDMVPGLRQTGGMKTMRRILSRRPAAALLTGLMAWTLLFHGLLSLMAGGAVVGKPEASAFPICSPSGTAIRPADGPDDHPLQRFAPDCCTGWCQAACAAALAVAAPDADTGLAAGMLAAGHAAPPEPSHRPDSRDLVAEARAPPARSV